ncbi:MAG: 30S ribosome-binding factor RbfA [Sphingomonadaceae bacterium]
MKRAQDEAGRSLRTLKVGEAMRHALADMLARGAVRDDVLDRSIVSVSEVRVSPDLRHATAFVMPVGSSSEDQAAVLAALNAHARQFRHEIARAVNTRYAADIRFRLDESYAEGERIDALLRSPRVRRDLAPPAARGTAADEEE